MAFGEGGPVEASRKLRMAGHPPCITPIFSAAKPIRRYGYLGRTSDLNIRLADHAGKCPSPRNQRPWRLNMDLAFETPESAQRR